MEQEYEVLNLEDHGREIVEEGWQWQNGVGVWCPFHRQYYDNTYRANYWWVLLRAGKLRRPIKKEIIPVPDHPGFRFADVGDKPTHEAYRGVMVKRTRNLGWIHKETAEGEADDYEMPNGFGYACEWPEDPRLASTDETSGRKSERLLRRSEEILCDVPRVVIRDNEEILETKRQTGGIYNAILIDRKPLSKLDKVKGIGASAKVELTLMADDMWEV